MIADSMGLDSMTTLVLIYSGYKLDGMKGMILALLMGVVIITLYKLGLFDDPYKYCDPKDSEDEQTVV